MSELTRQHMMNMILRAVENIKANHVHLSELDAAVGDGDHGAAMLRVAEAVLKVIEENKEDSPALVLEKIGWAVMGIDGGSTGPLMGSFFAGMGQSIEGDEGLDALKLLDMFDAGFKKVQTLTKAQVGDKTMIDALVPAMARFKQAIEQGRSIPEALERSAQAALKGAESTKQMQAKFGRARNLGDRTIGHMDPGAMSVAYIFAGFRNAFEYDIKP